MANVEAKPNAKFVSTVMSAVQNNWDELTAGQQRRWNRYKKLSPRRQERVMSAWQNAAADRYEEETGNKVASFGDGTFLKWLIENFDLWFPMLLKILALFGLTV